MADPEPQPATCAPPASTTGSGDAAPVPVGPATRHGTKPNLRVWLRDLLVAVAIAIFIIVFLYQPVKVEGTSMMPGLEDQERIFINKFVYRMEAIERGDVVVFRYPRDLSKSYIKRVVGVAGDRVKIVNGTVYLNGKMLVEGYVPASYVDSRSYPETVIQPGEFFVLGDHRSMSSDSRDFGPIEESFIYGKAVFAYWPMQKAGVLK